MFAVGTSPSDFPAVLQEKSTPQPLRVYPAQVNDYGKIYVKFTKD